MHNNCSSNLLIIDTENLSQTIMFVFNTKNPFRKMGQIWLCLWATTQDWSKTLKLGIKFLLKFSTIIYLGQNACMTRIHQYKQIIQQMFCFGTYRIDSVTAAFLVVDFRTWPDFDCLAPVESTLGSSGLCNTIEDDISHCVAAAYCRHMDLSLSTFCNEELNKNQSWEVSNLWQLADGKYQIVYYLWPKNAASP